MGTTKDLLAKSVNQEKVGHIVIDGLHQILPHLEGASLEELMLAFIMMIKTSVYGHSADQEQKEQVKALFDALWPTVIVDPNILTPASTAVH